VWEERAKELVCLSSSSYAFDAISGWHDLEGCWVGENVHAENLVVLYPLNRKVEQGDLTGFRIYAEKIAGQRNKVFGELILAFRDEELMNELSFDKDTVVKTENTLLGSLVDFTDYCNEIRKRVSINCLPDVSDIPLRVEDVYVDSKFSFLDSEIQSTDSVEEYIFRWIDEPGQKQIALLGDYGQGKSTTTLMLTYHLLFQQSEMPNRIPILIELRGKSPKTLQPLELLGAWASQYCRIDPKVLIQLHYAGRLLLIFEGFDEMAMVSNAEMRMGHFKRLWEFCHPGAKILITGRPNFFLDDIEKQNALGIYEPRGNGPYSKAIKLEPFTSKQIKMALRNHSELVREQICDLASRNSRFMEIVARPSLLHIVADLWEKEKLSEKTHALNSAAVMKLFVDRSYRRQGRKEGDNRRFMALNSSERDYFMQGVASYMAAERLNNQITSESLNSLIERLIEVIPDSVSTDIPITLGEERRPLSERLQEPLDYEDVKTDVRTCGLLVDDPATPNAFKFGHKSFMEYLFSSTIFDHLNFSGSSTEKSNAIFKATGAELTTLLRLPVSVEFLAELLHIDSSSTRDENNVRRIEIAAASRILKRIRGNRTFKYIPLNLNFLVVTIALGEILPRKKSNFSFYISSLNRNSELMKALSFLMLSLSLTITLGLTREIFQPITINSTDPSKTFLSGIVVVIYVIFTYYFIASFNPRIIRQLRVWNAICRKMNIPDEALHEAFGTSKIPWCRNKPFNYFIRQSDSDVQLSIDNRGSSST
jgi:hypothetical protein